MKDDPPLNAQIGSLADDLRPAVAFLTRLPVRRRPERPDFARVPRVFPLIGAAIGVAGGLVILFAAWLGEPALLGGDAGRRRDDPPHRRPSRGRARRHRGRLRRRTELPNRSSRSWTTAGSEPTAPSRSASRSCSGSARWSRSTRCGAFRAALALIAAEAASRAAMVRLWHALPAARHGGLSDSAGAPDERAMLTALIIALAIVVVAHHPQPTALPRRWSRPSFLGSPHLRSFVCRRARSAGGPVTRSVPASRSPGRPSSSALLPLRECADR